ncbi:peptidoglycan/xylan/chitin deacetylase (PgdA/CDA1 family) [Pedobacter sp. UYP30]|uniref:polysaccharide deacetylase family protein n=1 Tax=Pedobacter sp. UYP30 TaxID=1756400 RepID=UPI00339161F2
MHGYSVTLPAMYLVKSPFFLKWYYPQLLWNKPRSEKTIYITFDDGPIPIVTPFVLKTLAAYNAKATFFCIGDNIRKHPDVFNAVVNSGHAIGNHTFNHLNGWKTDDETYIKNILEAQALTQTNLFRPPYGRIKKSQIRKLKGVGGRESEVGSEQSAVSSLQSDIKTLSFEVRNKSSEPQFQPSNHYPLTAKPNPSTLYPPNPKPSTLHPKPSTLNLPAFHLIMWDVLSGDFDTNLAPEKCYQNVIINTQNGSIIVFHDSLKAFDRLQYALPRVLKYFTERGFSFERL